MATNKVARSKLTSRKATRRVRGIKSADKRRKRGYPKTYPAIEAFEALSFVRRGKKRSDWDPKPFPDSYIEARRVCSDGDVVDRGVAEYGLGCDYGKKAAREYIDYLKQYNSFEYGGSLQHIAIDMLMGRNDSEDLINGHAVGFFTELERWLRVAAKNASY